MTSCFVLMTWQEIAYELMLHCIMCQMCRYGDRKQILNEEQQQKMIAHISSALNVESVMQSRLKERVKHTTQYGKDPLLLELSHKMQLIDHHPNYPVESFEVIENSTYCQASLSDGK